MNLLVALAKKGVSTIMSVLVMAFLLIGTIQTSPAYADDESITVSCFKGNSEEGNYIGEISVNQVRDAASDCNQAYQGCQGACLGCVIDAENQQVCFDPNGEKVSR